MGRGPLWLIKTAPTPYAYNWGKVLGDDVTWTTAALSVRRDRQRVGNDKGSFCCRW